MWHHVDTGKFKWKTGASVLGECEVDWNKSKDYVELWERQQEEIYNCKRKSALNVHLSVYIIV